MKREEFKKVESGEIIVTVDFLELEILKAAPSLLQNLINVGKYGKGQFGSRGNLTEEEEKKGKRLVTIDKQIDTIRYLLDKIWKTTGKSPGDAEKSQAQLMTDLGQDAETEPTKS